MSDYSSILFSSNIRKCRLCFDNEKGLIYIFEGSGSLKNVARTILEVLNYKIFKEDLFPPFICTECVDRLYECMAFKVKCDSKKETYECLLGGRAETSDPACTMASTSQYRPSGSATVSVSSKATAPTTMSSTKTKQAVKEGRKKGVKNKVTVESSQQASTSVAREAQQRTDKAVNGGQAEAEVVIEPKNVFKVSSKKSQAVNEKEAEVSKEIELQKGSKIIEESVHVSNQRENCGGDVVKEIAATITSAVAHKEFKNSRKRKLDEKDAKAGRKVCEDSCDTEEDNGVENSNADFCVEDPVPSTSQDDGCSYKRSKLTLCDRSLKEPRNEEADCRDIANQAKDNDATITSVQDEDSQDTLQDAERETEEEEELPVECDRCLERFWMKYSQKKHLRVQVIKRPYQCEVCWKRFAKKRILTAHRLMHRKEKPKHNHHPNYPCPWEPLYTFIKSHFEARYRAIGGYDSGQSCLSGNENQESAEIPSVSGEDSEIQPLEAELQVTAKQNGGENENPVSEVSSQLNQEGDLYEDDTTQEAPDCDIQEVSSAVKNRRNWRKRVVDVVKDTNGTTTQETPPIKKRRRWRWKNGIAKKRKKSPENTAQDCGRSGSTQAATTSNTVNVHSEVKMQLRKRRRRYNFHRGKWELIPKDHGRYLRPRKKTNYRLDYTDSDCESIKSVGMPNQVPDSSTGDSSNLTKNGRSRKETSSVRDGSKVRKGVTSSRIEGETSRPLVRPKPFKKLTILERSALRFYNRNRKMKSSAVARKRLTDKALLPSSAKVGTVYGCTPCMVSVQRLACAGSTNECRNNTGDQVTSTAPAAEDNLASAISIDPRGREETDINPGSNSVSSTATTGEVGASSVSKQPEEPRSSEDNNAVFFNSNPTGASSGTGDDKTASMDKLECAGSVVSIISHLKALNRSPSSSDGKKISSGPAASGSKDVSCSSNDSVSENSLDSNQTLDEHSRVKDSNHPMEVIPLKASNDGEFRFLFKKVPKKHKSENDDMKNSKKTMTGSVPQSVSAKQTCYRNAQAISTEQEGEVNVADGVKGTSSSVEGNSSIPLPDKRSSASTKEAVSVQKEHKVTKEGKTKVVEAKNMKKEHILAVCKQKANEETSDVSCPVLLNLSRDHSGTSETILNCEDDVESSTDESNKVEKVKAFHTGSQDGKDSRMSCVQKLKSRGSEAVVTRVEMDKDISTDSQKTAGEVKKSCPGSSQKQITQDPLGTSLRISKDNSNTSKKNAGISVDKYSKADTFKKNYETLGKVSSKAPASEARKAQAFGNERRESRLDTVKDNKPGSSQKSMSHTYHKGSSRKTSQSNYKASGCKSVDGIRKEGVEKSAFNKEGKKKSKRDVPSNSSTTATNTFTNRGTDEKAFKSITSNPAGLKKSKHQGNHTSSLDSGPPRISSHSRKSFDGKHSKEATRSRVPSLTAPETYIPRKDKSRRSVSESPPSSSTFSVSCSKVKCVSKPYEHSSKSEKSKADDEKKTEKVRSYSHHSCDRNKNESNGTSAFKPDSKSSKSQKIARRRSTSAIGTEKNRSAHHSNGKVDSERSVSNPDSEKTTKSHKGDKKRHDSSIQTTSGTSSSHLEDKASSRDDKSIDSRSSAKERSKIQTEVKKSHASVVATKPRSHSHTADGKRIKEGSDSDPVAEKHSKSQERERKCSTSSTTTLQITSKSHSRDKVISTGAKRIHSIPKCIVLAKQAKIDRNGHSCAVKSTFGGSGHHSLDKHRSQTTKRSHSNSSKDRKSQKDDKRRHISAGENKPDGSKHHSNDNLTMNVGSRSTVSNPVAMVKSQKSTKESSPPAKTKVNVSSSHLSNDNRNNERHGSDPTAVKEAKIRNESKKVDALAAAKKCSAPGSISDDKLRRNGPESNSSNRSKVKTSKTLKDEGESGSLVTETATGNCGGQSKDTLSNRSSKKSDRTQCDIAISQDEVGSKGSHFTSLPSTSSCKSHSNGSINNKGSKTSKLITTVKEISVLRKDESDVIATDSPQDVTCSASNGVKSISNVSRQNGIPSRAELFTQDISNPLASADESKESNSTNPLLNVTLEVPSTITKSKHKSNVEINKEDFRNSGLDPTAVKAAIFQKDPIGNNASGSASKCFDDKSSSFGSKCSATTIKPSVICRPGDEISGEGSQKSDLKSTTLQKSSSRTDLNSVSKRDRCDTSNPCSLWTGKRALVQIEGMPAQNAFKTLVLVVTPRDTIPTVAPYTSESIAGSSAVGFESKCTNKKEGAGRKGISLTQVEVPVSGKGEESFQVIAEQIKSRRVSNTEVKSSKNCSKSNVSDPKALERSVSEEKGQASRSIPEPSASRSCNSNQAVNHEESDKCPLNSAAGKAVNSSDDTFAKPSTSSAVVLVNPRLINSSGSLESTSINSEKKSAQSQELPTTTSKNEGCFSQEECSDDGAESSDIDPDATDTSTSNKNTAASCIVVHRISKNSGMIKDRDDKSDSTVVYASQSQGAAENCFNSSTRKERNSYCNSSSENQKSNPGHSEESQLSTSIKSTTISPSVCITSADHSERSVSQDLHSTNLVSCPPIVKYICAKCETLASVENSASNLTPREGFTSQTDPGSSSGILSGNCLNNSASLPESSSINTCNNSDKSNEGRSQEMPVQNPSKSNTSEQFEISVPKDNLRTYLPPRKPRFKYLATNYEYLSGYKSTGSSNPITTPTETSNSLSNAVTSTEMVPNNHSCQSVDETNNEAPQRNALATRRSSELENDSCLKSSISTSANNVDSPGSTSIMSTSENVEWKLIPISINHLNRNASKPTATEINSMASSSKTDSVDVTSTSTCSSSNSGDKVCDEDSKNRFMNILSLRKTMLQRSVPDTSKRPPQHMSRRSNLRLCSGDSCLPIQSQRIHSILEQLEVIRASYIEALNGSGSITSDERGVEVAATQEDPRTNLNISQVFSTSSDSISSAGGLESTLMQPEMNQSTHSRELVLQNPSITITQVAPSVILRSGVDPCRSCAATNSSATKSFDDHQNVDNNGSKVVNSVTVKTSSIHRDANQSFDTTLSATLIDIRPTAEGIVNQEILGNNSLNLRDREASMSVTEVDKYRHDPLPGDSSQSCCHSVIRSSGSSEGNHTSQRNDSLVMYAYKSASSAGCSTVSVPLIVPHQSCTIAGAIPSRDSRNVTKYSGSVEASRSQVPCLESTKIPPAASHSTVLNASSYLPHHFGGNSLNISQSRHFGTMNSGMTSSQRHSFGDNSSAPSCTNSYGYRDNHAVMYPERRRVEWGRSELLMNVPNLAARNHKENCNQRKATDATRGIYSYHSNYQFREVSINSSMNRTASMHQKDEVASTSSNVSSCADSGDNTDVSNPAVSKSRCKKDTIRSGFPVQTSTVMKEDVSNPAVELSPVLRTLPSQRFLNNPPITSTNRSDISIISSDHNAVNASAERESVLQTISSGILVNNAPSTSTHSGNSSCIVSLKHIPEKSNQSQAPSKKVLVQHPSISNPLGVHPKICTSEGYCRGSVPEASAPKYLSNNCDYLTSNGLARCSVSNPVTDSLDSGEDDESKTTERRNGSDPNGNSSETVARNPGKNQAPGEKVSTSQSTSIQSDSSSSRSLIPMLSHDSGNGSECDSYDSDESLLPPGTSTIRITPRKLESSKPGDSLKPSANLQESDVSISDDSENNLVTSGSSSISMQNSNGCHGDSSTYNSSQSNSIRPVIPSMAYRSRYPVHHSGCGDSVPVPNNPYWNPSPPTHRFLPPNHFRPYMRPYCFQRYHGNYRSPRSFNPPFMGGNSAAHFPGGQTSANSSYSDQLGSENDRVVSQERASMTYRYRRGHYDIGNASPRSSYFVPPHSGRSAVYREENMEYSQETSTHQGVFTNSMGWNRGVQYRGSMI